MGNMETGEHTAISFDPEFCQNIISAAEDYGMSIEEITFQLLTYILEDKKKSEDPDNTPMIGEKQ